MLNIPNAGGVKMTRVLPSVDSLLLFVMNTLLKFLSAIMSYSLVPKYK